MAKTKIVYVGAAQKEDIPCDAFAYNSLKDLRACICNDLGLEVGAHIYIAKIEVYQIEEFVIGTRLEKLDSEE